MEFTPQNDLERALVAATKNPSFRAHFYNALLTSDLFVILDGPLPVVDGKLAIDPSTQVKLPVIQVQGQPHIPIFSAKERVSAVAKGEVRFIGSNGRSLLTMLRSANLVLNPGSPVGKLFAPQEIESLLNGSIFQQLAAAPVSFPVRLTAPEPAVPQLVDSLNTFFAGAPETDRAYLTQANFPPNTLPTRLLVGVEVNGEWPAFAQRLGETIKPTLAQGQILDFIRIDSATENSVLEHFRSTVPIYEKASTPTEPVAEPTDSAPPEIQAGESQQGESQPEQSQSA